MTAIAIRPVAVDIPRLLSTEGSSPSPTRRLRHLERLAPYDGQRAPLLPAEPSARPQYPTYPSAQPSQLPPPGPHPGYSLPPGTGEVTGYYPPSAAGGNSAPAHPAYPVPTPSAFVPTKRPLPEETPSYEPPHKKQSKWTEEEDDQLITLRGEGMKWEEIAKHVPGRSAIACRLHYQNFLERRAAWDEEKKNKLAQLYNRLKGEIWDKIARELHMPWRAVEEMHWRMGRHELAQRAGVREFVATTDVPPPGSTPVTGIPITTSFVPTAVYQPQPSPYTSPQGTLTAAPPRTLAQTASPIPPSSLPPLAPLSIPPQSIPSQTHQFIDPTRPPPAFTSGSRSPGHHAHRSSSSHPSPPRNPSHQSRRSGSDWGSPRRHALSSSRLPSASMPPLEVRTHSTPPPPLPPLPKDLPGPTSEPVHGMQLPPVRLLQEEVRSRLSTPGQNGQIHTGSASSRSHSVTRSNADQRAESKNGGH